MRCLLITAILIAATFFSCSRRGCTTPTFDAIYFQPDTVYHDTSATLSSYIKGSGFNTLVTSYNNTVDTSPHQYYHKVAFPQNTNVYDCDWRLVMHPSGVTFNITKITHNSNYEKRGILAMGEDKGCANTFYYTVNDSSISQTPDVNSNNADQATASIWVQYP